MTPREFESSLIKMVMPEEPVRQLTRLFEAVRYGAKRLDQSAEQQAVSSLESIIRAIREAP